MYQSAWSSDIITVSRLNHDFESFTERFEKLKIILLTAAQSM
jgi:hypothetical protein